MRIRCEKREKGTEGGAKRERARKREKAFSRHQRIRTRDVVDVDDVFRFLQVLASLFCLPFELSLPSSAQRRPRSQQETGFIIRMQRGTGVKRREEERKRGTMLVKPIEKRKNQLTVARPPLPRQQRLPPGRLLSLVDRRVRLDADDGLAELVLAHRDGTHGGGGCWC